MTQENQDTRRARIEAAAYDVLLEKGYKSASMLTVARRAKASNETMYRWYGDKAGLFRSLVETNAKHVADQLALISDNDPLVTLSTIAPKLLGMVTGERAIALNRAAAANVAEGGDLGAAIAAAGRDTIAPLLARLIRRAHETGILHVADEKAAADLFIRLLIGDLQIRRVVGVLPPLTTGEIEKRAADAVMLFTEIHATET